MLALFVLLMSTDVAVPGPLTFVTKLRAAGFEWRPGILPSGHEIHAAMLSSLDQAIEFCNSYKGADGPCVAFTALASRDFHGRTAVYFKNKTDYRGEVYAPGGWQAYGRLGSFANSSKNWLSGGDRASWSPMSAFAYSPREKGLSHALQWASERMLNETLPRAKSKKCQELIWHTATEGMKIWERFFPRHAFAELHCHLDYLTGGEKVPDFFAPDFSQERYKNDPRLLPHQGQLWDKQSGKVKSSATLAFTVLLSGHDPIPQVRRLLDALVCPLPCVRPDEWPHYYNVMLDRAPADAAHDALAAFLASYRANVTASPASGRRRQRVRSAQHFSVSTGDQAVDVVYATISMQKAYTEQWRKIEAACEASGQRGKGQCYDFLINLSGADYPIKSVGYMAKVLAEEGYFNHITSFQQVTKYALPRYERDWFITCPDEPCHEPSAMLWERYPRMRAEDARLRQGCRGYTFWLPSSRKPPLQGVGEFGGSAFHILLRDFVAYALACLDRPHDASAFESEVDQQYCASVRGIYAYNTNTMSAEEVVVQTWLMNSQFCAAIKGGLAKRIVDWPHGRAMLRGGSDVAATSPGLQTGRLVRSGGKEVPYSHQWFAPTEPNFFARKFALSEAPGAYVTADAAAAEHDRLREGGESHQSRYYQVREQLKRAKRSQFYEHKRLGFSRRGNT